MNYLRALAAGIIVAFIYGCNHTAKPLEQQLTAEQVNALVKVYQFEVKAAQITFVVTSNGCTQPEHFELKQQYLSDGSGELALLRLKADCCRAMPRPYAVSFKLDQGSVGKADIRLLNPMGNIDDLPGKLPVKRVTKN